MNMQLSDFGTLTRQETLDLARAQQVPHDLLMQGSEIAKLIGTWQPYHVEVILSQYRRYGMLVPTIILKAMVSHPQSAVRDLVPRSVGYAEIVDEEICNAALACLQDIINRKEHVHATFAFQCLLQALLSRVGGGSSTAA